MPRILTSLMSSQTSHSASEYAPNLAAAALVFYPINMLQNVGSRLKRSSFRASHVSACRTCFLSAATGKIQQIAKVGWTFNSNIQGIHVGRCEDCNVPRCCRRFLLDSYKQIASSLIFSSSASHMKARSQSHPLSSPRLSLVS
jgi:hypothetical protein